MGAVFWRKVIVDREDLGRNRTNHRWTKRWPGPSQKKADQVKTHGSKSISGKGGANAEGTRHNQEPNWRGRTGRGGGKASRKRKYIKKRVRIETKTKTKRKEGGEGKESIAGRDCC